MTGRVVWLTTSPRVAPGLLTADAWDAVRSGPVYTASADHPQFAALGASVLDPAALRDAAPCTWLANDGEDDLLAALGEKAVVVAGSHDLPGARLLDAVAVMDRLRSPGGCPWDAEQTHASLAPYLIEETYEAYQAIEDGLIDTDLREELGDVLLQVLFHARLGEERAEPWSVDDVAAGLVAKLVGRHPHVFGDASADDAAAVERNWDAIKAAEKGRTSVVDGVPLAQPALSLAAKLVRRARRAGLPDALEDPAAGAAADELVGRALFGLVARAQAQGIDPEAALRTVARRYADQVRAAEAGR
ncbi:MAG TPA: MazG family protein [Mycobacteriales bacterium]